MRIHLDGDSCGSRKKENQFSDVNVHERTGEFLKEEKTGDGQQAPFPAMTAFGVCQRIFKSSHGELWRAYRKSRRTMSSNPTRLRPSTCHSPVIPGFASNNRRRCQVS